MKEFKGTKSEWKIDRHPEVDSSGRMVFRVSAEHSIDKDEIKANAKLIAAATDLLEALQDCLNTLKIIDDTVEKIKDHETYFNATRNSMELAQKAIEKALN